MCALYEKADKFFRNDIASRIRPQSASGLIEMLDDNDGIVRHLAHHALVEIDEST